MGGLNDVFGIGVETESRSDKSDVSRSRGLVEAGLEDVLDDLVTAQLGRPGDPRWNSFPASGSCSVDRLEETLTALQSPKVLRQEGYLVRKVYSL